MIELLYAQALIAEKLELARRWALWKLMPRDAISIQIYRAGPAVMTGDELRLSTAPITMYRGRP